MEEVCHLSLELNSNERLKAGTLRMIDFVLQMGVTKEQVMKRLNACKINLLQYINYLGI